MNALLLSAGKGERLKPLTLKTPKCLLPFKDDKPILQYWIDILTEIRIETIFINIFHLKEQIINYVNSLEENIRNRVSIYPEEFLEPVGMVLSNLKRVLGSPFLIINSDTYIEKDEIKKFIQMAKTIPDFLICLGIEKRDNVRGKGLVCMDETGRVTNFIEKPDKDGPGYSYAGIMLMDTSIISNAVAKKELTQDILPDFKNHMTAIKIGNVIDIGGSLEVYRKAYQQFSQDGEHKECIYFKPGDNWFGGVYGDHMARYLFAKKYAIGKKALDLGCGSGYGTSLLSSVAETITGMDYNEKAIEFARRTYQFQCLASLEVINIEDAKLSESYYGIIIAFEILEHLKEPQALIEMVASSLTNNGIFIFSVPNELISEQISIYHNHVFTFKQIKDLVDKYFKDIEWFGQRGHSFSKENIEEANYFIGIAKK